MRKNSRGFTLIELLAVVAIIGLLVALVLPSLSRTRASSQGLACLAHLREFAKGWQIYADQNADVVLPGRMFGLPGGKTNPGNWYEVGNGFKTRPRWAAMLGPLIGMNPFNKPDKDDDQQDYDSEMYQCPAAPEWMDERNHAYGYNQQFLGNARQTNGLFHNFPVKRHRLTAPGGTVMAGDCLGTAAGLRVFDRGGYKNNEKGSANFGRLGDHAYVLDPPRLTARSDRGSGDVGSPRTAVDPRHADKANVVFLDGHAQTMAIHELGYRTRPNGRFVDLDPDDPSGDTGSGGGGTTSSALDPHSGGASDTRTLGVTQQPGTVADPTTNRLFSGTGRDDDPPPVPGK